MRQILGISLAEVNRQTSLSAEMLSRIEQGTRSLEAGELIELVSFYNVSIETIVRPWANSDLPADTTQGDLPRLVQVSIEPAPYTSIDREIFRAPGENLREIARDAVLSSKEGLEALSKSPDPETLNLLVERELLNKLDETIDNSFVLTNEFEVVLENYYANEDLEGKYFYIRAWQAHSTIIRNAVQAYVDSSSAYAQPAFLTRQRADLEAHLQQQDERFLQELKELTSDPDFCKLAVDDSGDLKNRVPPFHYLSILAYRTIPYPKHWVRNRNR